MAKNLKILIFPDPRLRKVAEKITKFDKSLESLANSMLKTMYDANGIGLAATQVDKHIRLIVNCCMVVVACIMNSKSAFLICNCGQKFRVF